MFMKHSCLNIHYIPRKWNTEIFLVLLTFLCISELFSISELCFHNSGTTSLLKDKAACLECHINKASLVVRSNIFYWPCWSNLSRQASRHETFSLGQYMTKKKYSFEFNLDLQQNFTVPFCSLGVQFMQTCISFILWQLQKSCSANKTQGFLSLTLQGSISNQDYL